MCWCARDTARPKKPLRTRTSSLRRLSTTLWKRSPGSSACDASRRPSAVDSDRLLELIDASPKVRVAVFGDFIADEFIYGEIARVSREAPVLILNYDSTEIVPGGAGNAANNVAALGGRPCSIGILRARTKPDGGCFDALPRGRVDVRRSCVREGYRTPTKTRILAGGIHSAKQQVVRIDRAVGRSSPTPRARARERGCGALRAATPCSCPTTAPASSRRSSLAMREVVREPRARPRAGAGRLALLAARAFAGMTACTPNESEVEQLLGVTDRRQLRSRSNVRDGSCCASTRCRRVLITRGSRGMALFEPDRPTVHIPDLRIRSDRRRHRCRRHRDRHVDAGARRRARRSTRRRTWPITRAASW